MLWDSRRLMATLHWAYVSYNGLTARIHSEVDACVTSKTMQHVGGMFMKFCI